MGHFVSLKGARWLSLLLVASTAAIFVARNEAIAQETADAVEAAESAPAEEAPAAPTLEEVNTKADVAALAGHNAWMLTSSALVLFMTVPGLAMFYGGLVRKKNVLSIIMQCLFLMAMMTVIWGLYGYTLSFGGDNPDLGGPLNA